MGADLKEALTPIRDNLKRLGLTFALRCPTLEEVKKALRKKQKLHHPDKTGVSDDSNFKQCMEDASAVIDFIQKNPELNDLGGEQEEDKFLLTFLRRGEAVKSNQGSYTVFLGEHWGDLEELVQVTEIKLEAKRSGTSSHYTVCTDALLLETMNFKNVTIHFYPTPADGKSKMLVQGKGYETFMYWVLPEIIKEAGRLRGMDESELVSLETTKPTEEEPQTREKVTQEQQPASTLPPTNSGDQDPLQMMIRGFHKLELTIVGLAARVGAVEGELGALRTEMKEQLESDDTTKLASSLASIDTVLQTIKNQQDVLAREASVGEVKLMAKKMEGSFKSLNDAANARKTDSKNIHEINQNINELVTAVAGGKVTPLLQAKVQAAAALPSAEKGK